VQEDVVEHQIRLCESHGQILQKFNYQNNDLKKRNVYYLETIDQKYKSLGWSLRVRQSEKKIELDIKKKVPLNSFSDLSKNLFCELDLHGNELEKTCKMNNQINLKLFEAFQNGEVEWQQLLSLDQKKWLNGENAFLNDTLLWGTLTQLRGVFSVKGLGDVTFDLVNPDKNQSVSYHEVSIRYPKEKLATYAAQFENFVSELNIVKCSNQIDWEVSKFEVLKPINTLN